MLAQPLVRMPEQLFSHTPTVLTEALADGINLAVWQRYLPANIVDFAQTLLALNEPLAESLTIEPDANGDVSIRGLISKYRDIAGYSAFIADVAWLSGAFACLLEAKRIGLRVRVLDKAMCPRFHVDHVPLRLITTYAGAGSEWLREGIMDRRRLGDPTGEPTDADRIDQLRVGDVALFKGEKWRGNEGAGIIHRSPELAAGERRLILTLDWLA